MRRLLKYASVLAFAVAIAIGVYIVFGSLSGEDIAPNSPQREAETAPFEPPPPTDAATPASIDEELDYMVARRLASLEGWRAFLTAHANGAYAQSAKAEIARRLGADNVPRGASEGAPALSPTDDSQGDKLSQGLAALTAYLQSETARVKRLLFGEEAPASSNSDVFAGVFADEKAKSESMDAVSSISGGGVRTRNVTVPHNAFQDGKPIDDAARPSAPPVGTDAVAGAQLAALAPQEICRRDEDRLTQLRSNPSRDEVARFANELGCEKLRPQILSLMESVRASPTGDGANPTLRSAQAKNETESPAPVEKNADVASPASEEMCRRDEERLVQLRSNPSSDDAQRFASELSCTKLRPQLQRLMESLDFSAPAPTSPPSSNDLLSPVCANERGALDRLRADPSAEAAGLFWRDLKCNALRPQVRLLMESLDVMPGSAGSAAAEPQARSATSSVSTSSGRDSVACRAETAELNRIRAAPDLDDAKRFASAVRCDALRPQVARLLESIGE
jgi:hypothetical protein